MVLKRSCVNSEKQPLELFEVRDAMWHASALVCCYLSCTRAN